MKPRLPLSLILGTALACGACICALSVPRPALAGAVYRCMGANGQLAFTNKPGSYNNCKKMTDYVDPPAPKAKAANASVKHSEYVSQPAGQEPAAAEASPAAATGAVAATNATTNGEAAKVPAEVRRGAVYKIVRANGVTEYTNIRPNRGGYQLLFTYISTCFACNLHSTVNWMATALNLTAYKQEVAAAATEFGVDASLLRAVIHAESAFNPNAISVAGAEGLMQLMPGTASDLGVANPFDVGQNIRGGAHYLAELLKQFNGNERLATAAYNAGPQNVQKYNNTVPPFDETRVYVDRVATLRQRYHAAE
ncbi:MAG TPA: lytic transglycosylase domain-containing protein [Rhodanobacteraceae bacterium]|nr:lytic transglycosylase domain-containing protein [Rhodanobacteraceae bacterium]